jgi:hypothetical protein
MLSCMRVPIACELTETAAQSQIGEWRDVLSAAVVSIDRTSATDLSFRLKNDTPLSAIVDLAQREKGCCSFFDFNILIDADSLALRVSVPAEATAILDDFARLAI